MTVIKRLANRNQHQVQGYFRESEKHEFKNKYLGIIFKILIIEYGNSYAEYLKKPNKKTQTCTQIKYFLTQESWIINH